MPRYQRILLKLSGEVLRNETEPFDPEAMRGYARAVREIVDQGVQVGIVVGGGNLLRGRDHAGSRSQAEVDQVGMLATVLNVGLLRFHLEDAGLKCRVFAPRAAGAVAEAFHRGHAIDALEEGRVVLLGGGTGNPFFSTDSAAALRAIELDCDAVLKGTMVDGVYDKDPKQHADAVRFDKISYSEVLQRELRVMDLTAIALCRDQGMRVVVFDIQDPRNLVGLLDGTIAGTVVGDD